MSAARPTQPPLVQLAAASVIILCALAGGVITGLIPGVSSQEKPVEPQAPAVETAVSENAAAPPVGSVIPPAVRAPIKQVKSAAPACLDCGVVESVNAVEVNGDANGAGAVIGGVAGLVVGNQIGRGKGKTLAKVVGAAGGAYAGHQIEKNMKKTAHYEVVVRMNDGTLRTVTQPSGDGLAAGARVKLVDNTVVMQ